jgi:hypothetical protein
MFIIVNGQSPTAVINSLKKRGEVVLFETTGITYPEVSGHTDLFFCHGNNKLTVAPNTPEKYIRFLKEKKISFTFGKLPVGNQYPHSARYAAIVTDKFLIHNLKITDPVIKEVHRNLEPIQVSQGYTRCSLLPLRNNRFITSDKGIEKELTKKGCKVLYVDPAEIVLPGFKHGFIGGTAGVWDDKVFFTGSLNRLSDGEKIRSFLKENDYQIIELSDQPLFDAGSILTI